MALSYHQIQSEALALSHDERYALAALLMQSLEDVSGHVHLPESTVPPSRMPDEDVLDLGKKLLTYD